MKQNKKVIGIILILIFLAIFGVYAATVYANRGFSENDEKNMVRMVSSLSKGADTNNEVNINTLGNLLNRYVGEGTTSVSEYSSDLIHVIFNNSGNVYEIDKKKGVLNLIPSDRYIITYNANGGIFLPYIQTGTQGEQIKITSMIPTRMGDTFLGWSTSSSATTVNYVPEDTYTVNNNATLYAVWTPTVSNSYIVRYNANGGTGAPATQTATKGQSITIPNQIPTREEYIFKGWAIASFLPGAQYQVGEQYTGTIDTTLYAVWEEEHEYTITFNANGGSDGPTVINAEKNQVITLPSTIPTRNGYTFLGWHTSSSASSPQYTAGGPFVGNRDITLWAVWTINYTITFNPNGGSGGPGTVSKPAGATITIPTEQPTRTGFIFIGWATSSSATSSDYSVGSEYVVSGNNTLYAVWASNTWTITYNANGGTFGSTTEITQSVTKEQSTTIISTVPTRTGGVYKFLGWSTSSSATTASHTAGATITPSSNMTLFAVWKSMTVAEIPVGAYIQYTANSYSSWRVMYNNSGQIDIVSTGSVGDRTLSGKNGYLNAVSLLNNYASAYVTGLATSARSIGCTSSSQASISSLAWNSKGEPYSDGYDSTDVSQLVNNGLVQTDTEVWLASRALAGDTFGTNFYVKSLLTDGTTDTTRMVGKYISNEQDQGDKVHGFRPVVSFPSGLQLVGGDGTSGNPYQLSQ